MKRKILLMGIMLLIISGCSKKDVTNSFKCEKSEVVDENTITEVINANFLNNQIQTASIKIENIVAEKYLQFIGNLEEDVKNRYSDYFDKQGINISVLTEDNKIITNINIDFNGLDENSKSIINVVDVVSTYGETKKALENSGYKCK